MVGFSAGKKGAKRVNYCFITFENWRSAQRACNQSERNIHGKASTHCTTDQIAAGCNSRLTLDTRQGQDRAWASEQIYSVLV